MPGTSLLSCALFQLRLTEPVVARQSALTMFQVLLVGGQQFGQTVLTLGASVGGQALLLLLPLCSIRAGARRQCRPAARFVLAAELLRAPVRLLLLLLLLRPKQLLHRLAEGENIEYAPRRRRERLGLLPQSVNLLRQYDALGVQRRQRGGDVRKTALLVSQERLRGLRLLGLGSTHARVCEAVPNRASLVLASIAVVLAR
eukprot:355915-Chlamydomonas_euryale.AAC.15